MAMWYFILFFTLLSFRVFSNSADSFEHLLKNASVYEKAKIYNDWSDYSIQQNDVTTLKQNALKALELSKKYKNTTEKGRAYYYLAYASFLTADNIHAKKYYLISISLLSYKTADNNYLGKAYNAMGVLYASGQSNDTAILYYVKALSIFKKTGDKEAEVRALNNLGASYHNLSNYNLAKDYYLRALTLANRIGYQKGISTALFSLGIIAENRSEYDKALKYYLDASKICEKLNDIKLIAFSYLSIGNIYYYLSNYNKALIYYEKAEKKYNEIDNIQALIKTYSSIGDCYSHLKMSEKAINYYSESLKMAEKGGFKSDIASAYYLIANEFYVNNNPKSALEYYQKANKIFIEIGNIESTAAVYSQTGKILMDEKKYLNAIEWFEKSQKIAFELQDRTKIFENYLNLSLCWQEMGNVNNAYKYFKLFSSVKDSVFNENSIASINELQTKYETEKKEDEIKILKQSNKIQELNIKKQKLLRNSFISGFILVLLLAIIIFKSLQTKKKDNKIIAAEKAKSEELLLNTLPQKVVNDLKIYGKTTPESFNDVTIFFSDIVGFTNMSTSLEPSYLISELNDIFTAFDDIMTKYGCERIKTIGDAYLAVCGMPVKNENHAEKMIAAACEILNYLNNRNAENELQWKIRIGINSGRVVGGIVGVRKYLYDVFGDAVNTASRMESNSEPMRINVSENTYHLLKDKFSFIDRPILEVKGKGSMKMYFLQHTT